VCCCSGIFAFQDTAAQVDEKIAWRTRMLDNKELLWLMARLMITVGGLPTRARCSGSKHIKLSKGLPGLLKNQCTVNTPGLLDQLLTAACMKNLHTRSGFYLQQW